jgi:hypothetical protein
MPKKNAFSGLPTGYPKPSAKPKMPKAKKVKAFKVPKTTVKTPKVGGFPKVPKFRV